MSGGRGLLIYLLKNSHLNLAPKIPFKKQISTERCVLLFVVVAWSLVFSVVLFLLFLFSFTPIEKDPHTFSFAPQRVVMIGVPYSHYDSNQLITHIILFDQSFHFSPSLFRTKSESESESESLDSTIYIYPFIPFNSLSVSMPITKH